MSKYLPNFRITKNFRIDRTFQTPEMSTGDYGLIDERGRVWVKDYSPQLERTGEVKGVVKNGRIYQK